MRISKWNTIKAVSGSTALALGLLFGNASAHAQTLMNVTYVGGTPISGNGIHGRLVVTSPDTLVFEGPSKIAVSYDRVISYESTPHKQVHVGLLTEGLWRLIAPWPEAKQLSLSYRDKDDHAQVAVLQMSRADEALLVEVLKTRVPRGGYRPPPTLQAQQAVVAQMKTADH